MQGSTRTGVPRPRGGARIPATDPAIGSLPPAPALLCSLLGGLSCRLPSCGLLPCRRPSCGFLRGLLPGRLLSCGLLCRLPFGCLFRGLLWGGLLRGFARRLARRHRRLGFFCRRRCRSGGWCGCGERRPLHRKRIHPSGTRPAHFHIMKVRHLLLPPTCLRRNPPLVVGFEGACEIPGYNLHIFDTSARLRYAIALIAGASLASHNVSHLDTISCSRRSATGPRPRYYSPGSLPSPFLPATL
jgi:hypothetical protein